MIMMGLLPISVVVTILRYQAYVLLEISETELSKFDTIFSAGKYEIILEIGILLMQPYPFLNGKGIWVSLDIYFTTMNIRNNYSFDFKLNYLLVILGMFRLFIILRVFLLKTDYMSPRANRVCRLYEARSDYLYAIKCLFKDYPLPLIGVFFVVSIAIFSLALRISERYPVTPLRDLKNYDPIYIDPPTTDVQDL